MSEPEIRVLVIDDNLVDIEVLIRLLKHMDVTCDVLSSLEFVEQLDGIDPINAIFLDLQMPGVNGFDVLETIHASGQFAGVPVIAYSSHLNEMPAARRAGFHSFLGKPLSSTKLGEQLGRILNGEPVWDFRD